jgi:hypothetical protein
MYELVSDVTRMGQWSPETRACRWVGGASGPSVGARFRGSNRFGWRRWSTTCTVTAADPGERFAFAVSLGSVPISQWSYEFRAEAGGCRVTEVFEDRRPRWMDVLGRPVMGIADRDEHNRTTMRATLTNLKRYAEKPATG